MDETKILLLGGEGFLGKGLQDELKARRLKFKSLDIRDCDLASTDSISFCVDSFEDITHIVLLASKIGTMLFNNPLQAEDAYQTNKSIADNTLVALQKASATYGRSYSLTYYSSCELFGNIPSEEAYTSLSAYNPIMSKKRHLYSKAKIDAEIAFKTCHEKHPKTINDVKIVRPFNVYGKNQKRGVVHTMLCDGMFSKSIIYAENTVRTLTGLRDASKQAVDAILADRSLDANIVNKRCCMTMKTLAQTVRMFLSKNYGIWPKLYSAAPDSYLQYRCLGPIVQDCSLAYELMKNDLAELAKQICLI